MCSKKEQQLVKKLIRLLQQEDVKVGDRLPSERKLAEQLEASRNSLRSAAKMLQASGVLDVKPGSGYYLRSKSNLENLLIQDNEEEERKIIIEQLEAFFLFEPTAVAISAQRMEEKQIAALEECIIELSRAIIVNNSQIIVERHEEFHHIIASGTGNRVIVQMLQRFDFTYTLVSNVFSKISLEERNKIFASHVSLFKAIKNRKPDEARKISEEMISNISMLLFKVDGLTVPKAIADKKITNDAENNEMEGGN